LLPTLKLTAELLNDSGELGQKCERASHWTVDS
jgi:hypothetical protein